MRLKQKQYTKNIKLKDIIIFLLKNIQYLKWIYIYYNVLMKVGFNFIYIYQLIYKED